MECLLPYLCMVTVPHIMVGLERMLDYRGIGLERFHCITGFMPNHPFSNHHYYMFVRYELQCVCGEN